MNWKVFFSKRAHRQFNNLPENIQGRIAALVEEIKVLGPIRGNWKNYGKLGANRHHCHVKSGNPTYVVCWEIISKDIRIIEVYYAGTHEKADY